MPQPRLVKPNIDPCTEQHQKRVYATNAVKSTRYNIFNFVPITFFLQFTKVINCFYLINMILQSVPQVSTNTWYFSVIPLAGLIMFGMGLEAVNEIKRWSEDKKTNAQSSYKVKCRERATLEHISELRTDMVIVGDIIVVKDDETVPADCLLISTDPSKQNMGG